MKLTTNKKELLKLLERCNGVADKKSPIPAMANVLLTTETSGLRLSAMSVTQSVTGTVAAKVTKQGSILVSCATFLARVNSMPDGELQLTLNKENALAIKHATSSRKFQIGTIPADAFPSFPNPDEEIKPISVPASLLSSLIASSNSAVSTDDTRPALNCLLVEFTPGLIRCVATDGKRMNKVDAKNEHASKFSLMIPLLSLQQLRRIVDIGDKPVDIRVSASMAFFDADGIRFGLKLVDAQFPPYEQFIPNSHNGSVTVSRSLLIDSVKALGGAVQKDKGVKVTIEDGVITIESNDSDNGAGEDKIDGEGTGKTITGLDPKFFLDSLNSITGDSVDIQFIAGDELCPIVIVPTKKSEEFDVLTIVMPMRV